MKNISIIAVLLLSIISCKTNKKDKINDDKIVVNDSYSSFGNQPTDSDYLSTKEALESYKLLEKGDSVTLKFSSSINEVCSKKGCWMTLNNKEKEKHIMVRFKDYGFFVPLDAAGKEVIVEGKAFINQVSVSELQHYAEDAGKSEEEIAQITEPKIEYAFEATGVLIKTND